MNTITAPKTYRTQYGIGKAKYLVSHHDGEKKHRDGSPFYDVAIFKNKKDLKKYTDTLKRNRYTEK